MHYMFYERIAADICGTTPDKLFEKNREGEVVTARFFCMVYRESVLKLSQKVAAGRYGKDHATLFNGKKRIEEYKATKDQRYVLYNKFMKACEEYDNNIDMIVKNVSVYDIRNEIERQGWAAYVDSSQSLFSDLFSAIRSGDETMVRLKLEEAKLKINELSYLYEL